MDLPEELTYTSEHVWVQVVAEGRVRVGITDFAQDALGDVVYVDLPDVGTDVRGGEPMGEVESTKSVSDVYSPVSGSVVERNEALADNPETVNQDPYGDGWMVVIEMRDAEELKGLLDAAAYRRMVEEAGAGS